MTTITKTQTRPWDLTHLVSFLPANSELSDADKNIAIREAALSSLKDIHHHHEDRDLSSTDGLGDFSNVWRFLGAPADAAKGLDAIPTKDDYASDGAVVSGSPRYQMSTNIVDCMEGVEVVTASRHGPNAKADEGRQGKKNRKDKREEKRSMVAASRATLSETEHHDVSSKETPARKAASHGMTTRSMSAKKQVEYKKLTESAVKAVAEAAAQLKESSEELPDTPCPKKTSDPISKPLVLSDRSTHNQHHQSAAVSVQTESSSINISARARQRYTTPNIYKTNNLIPSSLQPSLHGKVVASNQSMSAAQSSKKDVTTPTIQPIVLRSGVDRDLALYLKLVRNFGSDLAHLVKPMSMINHASHPAGLHCFIDFSNIAIGFTEQLKRSRNIHPMQRVPDVNLSFDSLALLIERRRPVAKRVLVGSSPHIAAFDKAKAVGYEVSILEKVYKARELTERQIYFKEVDARRSGRKSSTKAPPHKIALQGSVLTPGGLETIPPVEPVYAPARYVEQGVDEILHLKMMESILDAETPSTMVLATGDANCGEYSSGFIAMVERALRKGWNVELTSWSRNTSSMYKHQAWTAAWGERFKIIELDDYAEELLEL